MKNGKRVSNELATIHYLPHESTQFAVVTSKAIGNAVVRNKVRRRAKAILFEQQNQPLGIRAVVRLRPEAARVDWINFSSSMNRLIARIK